MVGYTRIKGNFSEIKKTEKNFQPKSKIGLLA
jgi:hypothetical protein